MKTKANIGCGNEYERKHYYGVDIVNFGQEYVMDITKQPLPFKDESLTEIVCHNTLEHIRSEDIIFVMNECYRVLKREGIMDIIVPNFPSSTSVADPTHKSFWVTQTFTEYFAGGSPRNANYGIQKWQIESNEQGYTWEVTPKSIHVRLRKK